ncbi:MAG: 50S ribosomal protein L10 [Planctomycetes bacterium]|nr:50S ribosomal protein L10 [Planctomycetota bacterium]
MSKKLKSYLREDLKKRLGDERAMVVLTVAKLSVANANDLRASLRKQGARMTVLRNRVARHAFGDLGIADAAKPVKGMSAVAYGGPDGVLGVSRVVTEWTKKNKEAGVQVLGGFMEGQVLSAPEVEALAGLPSKNDLLAMIASAVSAPMQTIASQVNEMLVGVARAVDAVREQQEKAA